jgi:hypothetical protein
MINVGRKDFSSMSLLALEHISRLVDSQPDMYRPLLISLGA